MSTDTSIITALARKLQAENTRLRAENAALRAGQGHWPETDDSPSGEQVPRVNSVDELSHGMWVAVKREDGTWTVGTVNGNSSIISRSGLRMGSLADFERFVLLEDAPVRIDIPSEQVRFKGMTDLRYKEPAPTPRLTVHDLEVAPVGSWLARLFHNSRKKGDDGRWHKAWMFEGQHPESSEDLIASGWTDATLHYPERDDHE